MPIDTSRVQAPPKRSGSRQTPVQKAQIVNTQTPRERRTEGLYGLGQLAQGVLLMTGQWADAGAIGQHFPPVAQELAAIADSNELIAKPIDFLIEIGPYGALITAVLPLALQIAANHKWLDGSKLIGQGVVPPEVLEAQMKAQVARMQAEALRMQQAAMAEAEAAQAEYQAFMEKQNAKVPANV